MVDPLREQVVGLAHPADRLWKVHGAGWIGALTDYQWEITGLTPWLAADPDVARFLGVGAHAYALIPRLKKLGYRIELVHDRIAAEIAREEKTDESSGP